jgi:hypothetical protein
MVVFQSELIGSFSVYEYRYFSLEAVKISNLIFGHYTMTYTKKNVQFVVTKTTIVKQKCCMVWEKNMRNGKRVLLSFFGLISKHIRKRFRSPHA